MNSQGRKRIALIYEGVKAEEELLNNMKQTFLSEFSEVDTFHLPADGNIYMLWKRMVDDEFNIKGDEYGSKGPIGAGKSCGK